MKPLEIDSIKVWNALRGAIRDQFTFANIKILIGESGLPVHQLAHLQQRSLPQKGASKADLIEAIDGLINASASPDQSVRDLIRAAVARNPGLEPQVRVATERFKWSLDGGSTHAMEARDSGSLAVDRVELRGLEKRVNMSGSTIQKAVFVIHGRDLKLNAAINSFLRAIGLEPLEWSKAREITGKPTPYTWEIVDAALTRAQAIVGLFSPDDFARLNPSLYSPSEAMEEKVEMGQPRQNVLFEAGVAFGRIQERTVLIRVGSLRPMSDLQGHHIPELNNSVESRKEFAQRLRSAGCNIDLDGNDWLHAGTFSLDHRGSPIVGHSVVQPDNSVGIKSAASMDASPLRLTFAGNKTSGNFVATTYKDTLPPETPPSDLATALANPLSLLGENAKPVGREVTRISDGANVRLELWNDGAKMATDVLLRIWGGPGITVFPVFQKLDLDATQARTRESTGREIYNAVIPKFRHAHDPFGFNVRLRFDSLDSDCDLYWDVNADNIPGTARGNLKVRLSNPRPKRPRLIPPQPPSRDT